MAVPAPISVSRDLFPFPRAPFASSSTSLVELHRASLRASTIFGHKLKSDETEQTHLRLSKFLRSSPGLTLKASREPAELTQQLRNNNLETEVKAENGCDLFDDLKYRFLSFKRHKYLENLEHFQDLSNGQSPKFMVIACADSRVCPSIILGFQPGEAFILRNIANLVPPFENGPTETNAALEFSVNSLKVENVLVIGHSCCGGIRALMSMQDNEKSSSFIRNWVVVGKNARIRTEATVCNLTFDQQCRHCEKESVNQSLSNLLTYPWIEEKVAKGELFVHGGYYDFIDCTFEKWTLDYRGSKNDKNGRFAIKDRSFWC
ncbi:Carbonic anhydrase [Quillaja saponaria]|uniref:Carbonic anhydrase n=1 Tax=Quillaja saponaria TaxID=32244 RepID=A0AAD7KWB2_QUISA|nr:Carbonic anhydrase [Quillaja saponaria]